MGRKGFETTHSASEIAAAGADGERMMLEMSDTAEYWLGDENRTPLTAIEIFEWLTSLPDKYNVENGYKHGVVFTSFAFNYDNTQILKGLPFEKAYEYPVTNFTVLSVQPKAIPYMVILL